MAQPHTAPEPNIPAFHCPLCHAYAQQQWGIVHCPLIEHPTRIVPGYRFSRCSHCKEFLMWHEDKIVHPDVNSAPAPNEDLTKEIKEDYLEAASIVGKSPRGAAALLRLCVQKLCKELGEDGDNINEDIGSLVKKGMDVRVQRALDAVRVIGNESVHPGEMDLRDDAKTAGILFALVNAIANDMITQPRLRDEVYGKLPEAKRAAISKRDSDSASENALPDRRIRRAGRHHSE